MKYIFGPVKSRRLGISLGIDLVPYKTCSFDCIYCEVSKTTLKTRERQSFFKTREIKKEIEEFLKNYKGKLDYITLAGSGEPTLNKDLGEIVNFLKENYPYKVVLITNSSLLYREDVLKDIEKVDIIIPSLDTLTSSIYLKLNQPNSNLSLDLILEGLYNIKNLNLKIFLETLFVKGYNDTQEELQKFKEFILNYKPDEWQLNTVVRFPAYRFAQPVSYYFLKFVKDFVGYEKTKIYYYPNKKPQKINLNVENYILETAKRRPLDLKELLSLFEDKHIYSAVNKLKALRKIEITDNFQIIIAKKRKK